jgi:competence protein ComEC
VRLAVGGALSSAAAGWRAGRLVRVTASLRAPASYRNFGVPDDERAAARRGIALVGTVKSAALVDVVARGGALNEAAAAARAWARRRLADTVGRLGGRSAAVATAILIGDRSGIPDDDERRLQEAGTYHVIAISGGNIAILAALLLFALRACRVPPRAAAAITIAGLLFYGRVTGAPASVARAITAAVVFLLARMLDHRGPALNALAVAAAGAIAVAPFAVLDAGFILSFGATLGILLGVPRLLPTRAPVRAGRFARAVRAAALAALGLFAATLAAEAALLPAGAWLFGRVTFAGLILNFGAIPLMTVVQAGSLAVLALGDIDRAAMVAAGATHLAATALVESARLVEAAPFLSIDVLPPAAWLIVSYYAAWFVALVRPRLAPRAGTLALVAVTALVALFLTTPPLARRPGPLPPPRGLVRVTFLDVGQGDATLAQLPDGRALLVDAGGLPGTAVDAGERIVTPALHALGVRRLDTLVVTHADPDHAGGARSIVRRFTPRAIWEGVPVPPNPVLRELAGFAAASGAAWRTVQAGDVERLGEVEIRVWHPPPPEWERQRVRNDDSVVLEVRHGAVSILLTGDAEREAERAVAARLSLAPIVVLKAPHHGSATSSTPPFIAAARPAAVVISAGRRNPFGHPHPAVIARYQEAGVEIFRTDLDGAVAVDSDGVSATVRTFTGRTFSLSRR